MYPDLGRAVDLTLVTPAIAGRADLDGLAEREPVNRHLPILIRRFPLLDPKQSTGTVASSTQSHPL